MFQNFLIFMQALAAVFVVCVAAYLFIRFGLRPAYRGRGRGSGKVKLLDRMPLDSRGNSSLLLVEVGDKVLLLGAASGSITLIKEMTFQELDLDEDEEITETSLEKMPFADLLNKLRRKNSSSS